MKAQDIGQQGKENHVGDANVGKDGRPDRIGSPGNDTQPNAQRKDPGRMGKMGGFVAG